MVSSTLLRTLVFLVISAIAVSASSSAASYPLSPILSVFGTKRSTTTPASIAGAALKQEDTSQNNTHTMKVRGGGSSYSHISKKKNNPWGILVEDVKNDLLHLVHDQHDPSRCTSIEDVLHECVINYGSVMFGRF